MADEDRTGWWTASDGNLYPPEAHPQAERTQQVPSSPPPAWGSPPSSSPPGPPPGGYGYAPYGRAPGPGPAAPWASSGAPATNGLAIAAMVVGIGALVCSLIPVFGFFSVPFALAAVGLGIAGMMRAQKGDGGKGMAIAGIATGAVALVVSIIYVVVLVAIADDASDDINSDPSNGICNSDRFLQDPDC